MRVRAAPGPPLVARPRLTDRIDDVLDRRLTVVAADAGFGKSTLLRSWAAASPSVTYQIGPGDADLASFVHGLMTALGERPPDFVAPATEAQADTIACELSPALAGRGEVVLLLDDLHQLGDTGAPVRLVEALCRHAPPNLHMVAAGRRWPSFAVERLRGQGQLLVVDSVQLAFTADEVAALLECRFGTEDPELATALHEWSGGWPAAVVLAAEALRDAPTTAWPDVVVRLAAPGRPMFTYLAEEIFDHLDGRTRQLIRAASIVPWFTADLCEYLGFTSVLADIEALGRNGVLVELRHDGTYSVRRAVRDVAAQSVHLTDAEVSSLSERAADWFAAHGEHAVALSLLTGAAGPDRIATLLHRAGPALVSSGQATAVLDACRAVRPPHRTTATDQLEGDGRLAMGDWAGALACFERADTGEDPLPAALAWRLGYVRYQRGELEAALHAFQRGGTHPGDSTAERSALWAWQASANWVRGDIDGCRALASRAHELALSCGDGRALAASHTALALVAATDGDRRANDLHYIHALRAAEEAGDVLQIVRIHINRASHFIEEGLPDDALTELDAVIPLAELGSLTSSLGLALCNRAQAHRLKGRLDEALADFEASRAAYERIGSDMVAYALTGAGDIHRERGNLAQARVDYREAAAIAERSGDLQGLAPALAGLAMVTAGDDPDGAAALAERALGCGTGLAYVGSLLASGWVAAHRGDRERAREFAATALGVARPRRDRVGAAEALLLDALCAEHPARRTERIAEAVAMWERIGDPIGATKARLCLAAAVPGGRAGGATRRELEGQLATFGVRAQPGAMIGAGAIALIPSLRPAAVTIETLGAFSIVRASETVPRAAWQSKRARELLKFLVARRGRPVPREVLMETLWPDEDQSRVNNRLSVALSTVRAVLDPDRTFPADEFIVGDNDTVVLNLDAIDVDLERFLVLAADGLAQGSVPLLTAAAAAYGGDFLEENPYDDWAVPVREEARATYIAVERALAREAGADPDAVARHLLRILELDPYDEEAHLDLVGTLAGWGRFGEAQRHYLTYRRRMDELAVEPMPFPAPRARPKASLRGAEGPWRTNGHRDHGTAVGAAHQSG